MRLNAMRKRSVAAVAVFTVLIGLLTATPALATYRASIQFHPPQNATTFFSPFSGPAEITFNFDDNPTGGIDPPTTFNVRLRYENGATIHSQNFTITPQAGSSPDTVQFNWPALNVTSNTNYEVAVYRTNGTQLRERRFTLRPRLLRITSINPDPFFPTINDGYQGHDEDHVPAPGELHPDRQGPGPRGGYQRGLLRRRGPGRFCSTRTGWRARTDTSGMAETTAE